MKYSCNAIQCTVEAKKRISGTNHQAALKINVPVHKGAAKRGHAFISFLPYLACLKQFLNCSRKMACSAHAPESLCSACVTIVSALPLRHFMWHGITTKSCCLALGDAFTSLLDNKLKNMGAWNTLVVGLLPKSLIFTSVTS